MQTERSETAVQRLWNCMRITCQNVHCKGMHICTDMQSCICHTDHAEEATIVRSYRHRHSDRHRHRRRHTHRHRVDIEEEEEHLGEEVVSEQLRRRVDDVTVPRRNNVVRLLCMAGVLKVCQLYQARQVSKVCWSQTAADLGTAGLQHRHFENLEMWYLIHK